MHQCVPPPLLHMCSCSISRWDSQRRSPLPHSLALTSSALPLSPQRSPRPPLCPFRRHSRWRCVAPSAVALLLLPAVARSLAWPWLAAARAGRPATAVAGDHSCVSLKLGHPAGSLLSKGEEEGSRFRIRNNSGFQMGSQDSYEYCLWAVAWFLKTLGFPVQDLFSFLLLLQILWTNFGNA